MDLLNQGISLAPYAIVIISLLAFLISNDLLYIRFAFYSFLTMLLYTFLKKMAEKSDLPDYLVNRPRNTLGYCSSDSGMPSGHAMIAGLTASFWLMYIWNQDETRLSKIVRSSLVLIIAGLIFWNRIENDCHTITQVLVGAIIGIILGMSFWSIEQVLNNLAIFTKSMDLIQKII